MRWLLTTSGLRNDTRPNYLVWLAAGGVEALPIDPGETRSDGWDRCDALLLGGGGDVDPASYGQEPHDRTHSVRQDRDRLEMELIRLYRRTGRPVFGICRGLQVLQVALGGPLIQHIPDLLEGGPFAVERHAKIHEIDSSHALEWIGDSRLGRALGSPPETNSAHHQAADATRLAPALRLCAVSPGGIVEAVESTGGPPLSAVQWHPERLRDMDHPAGRPLLAHWISIVRKCV